MAKKKHTGFSSEALGSQPEAPDNSLSGVLEVSPGIQLRMHAELTVEDLADAVIGDEEEDMMFERDGIEKEIRTLKGQHTELANKLTKQAEKLTEGLAANAVAKKLAKALEDFAGDAHHAETAKGKVIVDTQEVEVAIQVWRTKNKDANYSLPAHTRTERIKFSAEMKETRKELTAKAKEIGGKEDELLDVRKRLADVPHRIKRAKRGLVRAMASGQITDGESVMAALGTARSKPLPLLQG